MINVNKLTSEIIPLVDLMDKDGNLKTDTSAEMFPMMNDIQLGILKDSLNINRQREAVLTWRNKIVDGRNRCKALNELGVSDVTVKKLPHKMTEEERGSLVKLIENTRRHETSTQLACSAVREYYRLRALGEKVTAGNIVKKFPVSLSNFKIAKWIYENYRADFEVLFEGKGIQLNRSKRVTTSLTTVKRLRMEQEETNEFLNRKCEEVDGESDHKEYIAMVTLAKGLSPLIALSRDLHGFSVNEFAEILLDVMRPKFSHKVITTEK